MNGYNRCSVKSDDDVLGLESILLILVYLICGFDSGGFIGPKTGESVMQMRLICEYICCI